MVIVEGMDSSGKTTLVRKLSGDLQLLVMNNRRRPERAEDIFKYQEMALRVSRHFPTILDRLATISEPIYGPICRDTRLLSPGHLSMLMLQLKFADPLVIYCRPNRGTIFNFVEPQMEGVIKHRERLLKAYDESIEKLSGFLRVIRYNWETDPYEILLNQLKEKM